MIYQCPNCASALIYDPEQNCLVCHHCDSTFQPEEIKTDYMPKLRMNFHIYSCTACGAEIMVTENEAATFCVYCGQPVIVFDRVSSELQPDYIIPFKTTKEAAHASLRYSIRKKFFVPKEFKNFKPDTLRGIYIPFWLYDIDYTDRQYYSITGQTALADSGYYYKNATIHFKDFPISASTTLSDEELRLLGKYYLEEMEAFNPGYLSGFYADRYNINYLQTKSDVLKKAEEIFDYEMQQPLEQKYQHSSIHVVRKSPIAQIKKIRYVLLPVWFMTFQYKNKPYTLLLNGQTGCAAGNLPIHKGKAALMFLLSAITVTPIFAFLSHYIYLAFAYEQSRAELGILSVVLIAVYALIIFFGICFGYIATESIIKGLNFSRSKNVQSFVKERQDI